MIMENILLMVGPFFILAYSGFSLKSIVWLLGDFKVILPVTLKDLKNREHILNENKLKKKKDIHLLRTCSVEEYFRKANEVTSLNSIGIFFIFMFGSFLYYLLVIIYQKVLKKDSDYDTEFYYNNYLAFSYSLILLTFIHAIYKLFNRKNIKITIYVFGILLILFLTMNFLNKNSFIEIPSLYRMDEKTVCMSIENRISKILKKSKELNTATLFDENNTQNVDFSLCNKDILIIFGLIFVSIFSSIIYDIAALSGALNYSFIYKKETYEKISTIQNILAQYEYNGDESNNKVNTKETNSIKDLNDSFTYKYFIQLLKIKYILAMIIMTLLLDDLTFEPIFLSITELIKLKKDLVYSILIMSLILLESILGLVTLKYYWMSINQENYIETLKFTDAITEKDMNNETIMIYSNYCLKNNELSFDVLEKFVYYSSLSMIAVFTMLFKLCMFKTEDLTIKSWLSEYLMFLILISIYLSKSFNEIVYLFYSFCKNLK